MQALTIDVEKVKKCVESTYFTAADANQSSIDNFVLKRMQKEWKSYGTLMYPAIIINKMTFHGALTA